MRNIVWRVCQHELKDKARTKIFLVLFPLVQVLVAVALISCWIYVNNEKKSQEYWQAEIQKQWNEQPDRHPHRVAHYGTYGFRMMTPLSFFDTGVNELLGNLLFLEAHRQNAGQFSQAQAAGINLYFGQLTPANLLLIVWPLLLIAIAFNCISDERQSGRLRQLMSGGASLAHWLTGKALAYTLISLIFLLPLFLLSGLLAAFADTNFTSDTLLRLCLLFVVYFSYSLMWIGIVICCSLIQSSSQGVLALLLGFFLLFVMILPRFLSTSALNHYSYPTRAEFDIKLAKATAELGDSHNPEDPYFMAFQQKILTQYDVERIEDLPVNYAGLLMAEGERLSAEVYTQHYKNLVDSFVRQDSFIAGFHLINPYLLVRDTSMLLAASNSRHFFHFEQSAEKFRYHMIQQLNHLHTHEIHQATDKTQRLPAHYWQKFTSFNYQTPLLTWSLEIAGWSWLAYLFWMLVPLIFIIAVAKKGKIYAAH